MHASALDMGKSFFELYWTPKYQKILDVGSKDVNGSLRQFKPEAAEYWGIDLEPGRGVDQVLADPYVYPFADGYFDCIVSTSCLEHDKMFWLTFAECCRVVSRRGVIYLNVPASGPYHGFPFDHWRFYPDAAIALADWARRMKHNIQVVESFNLPRVKSAFRDCIMVFTKDAKLVPKEYLADKSDCATNVRKGGNGALTNMDGAFP